MEHFHYGIWTGPFSIGEEGAGGGGCRGYLTAASRLIRFRFVVVKWEFVWPCDCTSKPLYTELFLRPLAHVFASCKKHF